MDKPRPDLSVNEGESPDTRPESFKKWTDEAKPKTKRPKAYKRKYERKKTGEDKPVGVYTEEQVNRLNELSDKAKERMEAREIQLTQAAQNMGLASPKDVPRSWVEGGYKFSMDKMEIFCAEYAQHSQMTKAAKAAGVSVDRVRQTAKNNPIFEQMFFEAREIYKDKVIEAIQKRAIEGIDEPIIGGEYRDQVVAYKKVYSDRLLELEAKRVEPAYRDKGGIEINTGKGVLVVQGNSLNEEDWSEKYKDVKQIEQS